VTNDLTGSGLSDALIDAARAAGFEQLTALQAAALPVLRRGGSVVLHASSGAGVTAAFGLPLLDRLAESDDDAAVDGEGGPRGLVVVPTAERAEELADRLSRLAGATGLAVRALIPGWRAAGADVLVTTAERALHAVRTSALKLESVQTLVLTELADQFRLKQAESIGTLATLVPRDAQRVVTSAELDGAVEKFIEAQVRKALTVPARPADPKLAPAQAAIAQIGYIVVAEAEKFEIAARLLDGVEGDATVYARTAARAERVHGELSRRGIAAAPGAAAIRVRGFDDAAEAGDRVLSFDVPFSTEQLRRLHAAGGTVMVTPSELTHFRRIAAEAPFTSKQRRARSFELDEIDAFRQTVEAAIGGEDLSAQLLVLEPLFDAHSPAEVAAALSALLRSRAPATAVPAQQAAGGPGAPPKDASVDGYTRLFVSIGARDNVRAGDIVGAITGEAGIKGDQVGKIDIRDTFTVVEVASPTAEKVIRALNGTTMRGRSLRVDFDRKGGGDSGPRPSGPRTSSPRSDRGDRPRTGGGARPGPGDRPRTGGGPPRRRPPER
jgi:ATP-dependent RNA helicase DeaD